MEDLFKDLCAYMSGNMNAFTFLSKDDLKKVSVFFEHKTFKAGEILWKEGAPCGYVAFIISGRVQVKKKTEFKGNQVVLGVYKKGAYVGALCLLDGSPRAVTAEALDDACVIVITRKNFDKLSKSYPEIATAIMKGMMLAISKRLKKSFDRLVAVF
jgi:CRP-like cAMP-binding protein